MSENLTKVSETKKNSRQKETWSCKQRERSEENIDGENFETRAANEQSKELAANDEASECSSVDTHLLKTKHDLAIRELDILKERIMPLMPGKEVEWAIITRDITKTLTTKNKKEMLQTMCKKLKNHAEAFAKVKILLVHAAQRPDHYTNPLEKFYKWLLGRYKCTARQQSIKFNWLLRNMNWSWETNPVDQILTIMHEVHLTWDNVMSNDAMRDDFKAILASKMGTSTYVMLNKKPVEEWYAEITKIWEDMRINKATEENVMANLTKIKDSDTSDETIEGNKRNKICYKCGLNGHIAHNCKTGKIIVKQKNRIVKRCNFCRKRGHIMRNCPSRQKYWKWLEERSAGSVKPYTGIVP